MFEDLTVTYAENGSFTLLQGESINKAVADNKVPNDFGIYLIYSGEELVDNLVYIGMAGSISTDGVAKKQGIKRRLLNQHSGMKRSDYFIKYMDENKTSLKFHWYKTFDDESRRILPALAEAKVIQEYFIAYGRLPELNLSF